MNRLRMDEEEKFQVNYGKDKEKKMNETTKLCIKLPQCHKFNLITLQRKRFFLQWYFKGHGSFAQSNIGYVFLSHKVDETN